MSLATEKERMKRVLKALKKLYPDSNCALHHESAFQLLIATVLSAQCTDARVNMVTPELFKRFPNASSMNDADIKEIEDLIKSTGFYRNKALSLKAIAETLVERHGGEVPQTMEELTAMRGVGRKTANVVLGNAFDTPGLVVDTHVGRLTRRLGFTRETDPEKVEQAMMKLVPEKDWTLFSHLLIDHGRAICDARKPLCEKCTLRPECPDRKSVV